MSDHPAVVTFGADVLTVGGSALTYSACACRRKSSTSPSSSFERKCAGLVQGFAFFCMKPVHLPSSVELEQYIFTCMRVRSPVRGVLTFKAVPSSASHPVVGETSEVRLSKGGSQKKCDIDQ